MKHKKPEEAKFLTVRLTPEEMQQLVDMAKACFTNRQGMIKQILTNFFKNQRKK